MFLAIAQVTPTLLQRNGIILLAPLECCAEPASRFIAQCGSNRGDRGICGESSSRERELFNNDKCVCFRRDHATT